MHRQDPNFDKTDWRPIVGDIALIVAFPLAIIYGVWAWAIVLKAIWLWYVVPTFQIAPLTFTQCVAVSAVIGLFLIKSTVANHKPEKHPDGSVNWSAIWGHIGFAMCMPWITWVVYWFIKAIFI
jgi:hypothetical protein